MVKNKLNRITIKSIAIASLLTMLTPTIITANRFTQSVTSRTKSNSERIIVLDPGHGKASSTMSDSEKTEAGFVKNSSGAWGEWRHWKNGTYGQSCEKSGCAGTGSSCWYPIGNGDRTAENDINLNNANAAKKYLQEMGYTVRMTREDNSTHPSFTKRASYCFPGNDTTQSPDAELYVCIHSNAYDGNARGTAYIAAEGTYTQKHIPSDYVDKSNKAGDIINKKVAAASGLTERSPLTGQGYLIAFNKNPVPTAYLEIGFFDNASDSAILQSKSDAIGKAIAEGINEYLQGIEPSENTGSTAGSESGSGTTASKGKITISSNEEKFLGLWKNSEGKYIPYYSDPDKAKFNPDGKSVKYGNYANVVNSIYNADQWLFELLSSNERTQEHEKLMKYLMYKYNGKDYGVTSFDFSTFDIGSFTSASSRRLPGGALEVLKSFENDLLRRYMNGDSSVSYSSVSKYVTEDRTKYKLYYTSFDGCYNFSYGVMVKDKNGNLNNSQYFADEGVDLAAIVSQGEGALVDVEIVDRIKAKIVEDKKETVRKIFTDAGITLEEHQVDAMTLISYQFGNCGQNLQGDQNIIKVYQKYYQNGDAEGFKNNAVCTRANVGTVHMFSPNLDGSGQSYYVKRAASNWSMFHDGRYFLSDGTEVSAGGGDVLAACEELTRILIERNAHYSLELGSELIVGDIERCYSEGTYFCCATYVSTVLYMAGLLTPEQINPYGYHSTYSEGIPKMLKAAGWTQVTAEEMQPGDVVNWETEHVLIYAGNGRYWDQTSAVVSSSGSPPTGTTTTISYLNQCQIWRAP